MRRLRIMIVLLFMFTGSSGASSHETELARGSYLVNGIVACGNCNTPRHAAATANDDMRLAGGFLIEEPEFRAYAPNITRDRETGIGSWSDDEIMRAIREGVRPDGTVIGPPMPIPPYRDMSDSDLRSIVAYLWTVAPVRNVVPRSEYNIALPESWGPPVESVPDISRNDPIAYGAYLGNALGHCMECHTPISEGAFDFSRTGAGGIVLNKPFGLEIVAVAANITPHLQHGIGG